MPDNRGTSIIFELSNTYIQLHDDNCYGFHLRRPELNVMNIIHGTVAGKASPDKVNLTIRTNILVVYAKVAISNMLVF